MGGQSLDKLIIRWVEADGPRDVPIKGAVGGAHPDGSITIRFYSELPSLGSRSEHPIEDGAILWDEDEVEKDSHITRIIHLTSSMTPIVARQIAVWLLEKADEAESRTRNTLNASHDDDSEPQ